MQGKHYLQTVMCISGFNFFFLTFADHTDNFQRFLPIPRVHSQIAQLFTSFCILSESYFQPLVKPSPGKT